MRFTFLKLCPRREHCELARDGDTTSKYKAYKYRLVSCLFGGVTNQPLKRHEPRLYFDNKSNAEPSSSLNRIRLWCTSCLTFHTAAGVTDGPHRIISVVQETTAKQIGQTHLSFPDNNWDCDGIAVTNVTRL